MSYIHLLNQFWQFHATRSISPQATCLYLFLVQRCNRQHWTNPFIIADAHICGELGMARNTMRPARAQLVALGLIAHQPGGHGRGDAAQYALLDSTGQFLSIQVKKGAESIPFAAPLPSKKGAAKGIDSAPYSYKEENKTHSSVKDEDEEKTAAPAAAEREGGKSENGLTPIVVPNAGAAHTGGGAGLGPLLPFSASPYCTEAAIQQVARSLALGAVYAPYYLAQIRTKTEGEPDRTELKWRTYVQHFLTNDARRQQLVTHAPQLGSTSQVSQRQATLAQARAQRSQLIH